MFKIFLILLEHEVNICSEYNKILSGYSKSSIARINNRTTLDLISKYDTPPLLSEGWLLLCDSSLREDQIKKLGTLDPINLFLFVVRTMQKKELLVSKLISCKIKYSVLDNYNPNKENVLEEIQKEIRIEDTAAEFLYKRYHGYLPKIAKAIQALLPLAETQDKEINKADIRRFTEPATEYFLSDLAEYLLGLKGADSFMKYENAVGIIKNYRYALGHVIEYLQTYVVQHLEIFKILETNECLLEDIKEFKKCASADKIKSLTTWQITKYAEHYGKISYDKLMYVKHYIDNLSSNEFAICQLIFLVKVIGGL